MGLSVRTAASLSLPAAWLLLLAASPCAAQTTLRSLRMAADLRADDGRAEVRIEYELAGESASRLRFELLGFGKATTGAFWLGERRETTRVPLELESGSLATAERPPWAAAGFERHLVVSYRIEEAVERSGDRIRVHVPVLTLALPPADATPDVFRAEIRLPTGWAVSEGFPSGLTAAADGRYTVELAVTPSVVSLRARSDGVWRPGLPLALDVVAVLVLLAFGLRGWRHLRRIAAAPMEGASRP